MFSYETATVMATAPSLRTILSRSLRLKCAVCGQGRLFQGWFRMHERCPHCGTKFERAPGYFLGSIYFNYGLTALLVVVLYFSLFFSRLARPEFLLVTLGIFCVAFPAWFFRYARSLWFGFDHYWDPVERPD